MFLRGDIEVYIDRLYLHNSKEYFIQQSSFVLSAYDNKLQQSYPVSTH